MSETLAAQKLAAEIERIKAERDLAAERLEGERRKNEDWDRRRRNDDAEPLKNGVYVFHSGVDDESCRECIADLDHLSRRDGPVPIRVIFTSPGGSVFAGLGLFDFIQELRRRGHHVTTEAMGWSASMGAVLLQAGDKRVLHSSGWVMIHEPSSGAIGKVSELTDEAELLKRLHRWHCELLAERSSLTAEEIATRCDRRDWWLNADEAESYGVVDEVLRHPPFNSPG